MNWSQSIICGAGLGYGINKIITKSSYEIPTDLTSLDSLSIGAWFINTCVLMHDIKYGVTKNGKVTVISNSNNKIKDLDCKRSDKGDLLCKVFTSLVPIAYLVASEWKGNETIEWVDNKTIKSYLPSSFTESCQYAIATGGIIQLIGSTQTVSIEIPQNEDLYLEMPGDEDNSAVRTTVGELILDF